MAQSLWLKLGIEETLLEPAGVNAKLTMPNKCQRGRVQQSNVLRRFVPSACNTTARDRPQCSGEAARYIILRDEKQFDIGILQCEETRGTARIPDYHFSAHISHGGHHDGQRHQYRYAWVDGRTGRPIQALEP